MVDHIQKESVKGIKTALKPATPEAAAALPKEVCVDGLVTVAHFPFRIGRESRVVENREGRPIKKSRLYVKHEKANNDLHLFDRGSLLHISREHLEIVEENEGYAVRDKGSVCGTKVGNKELKPMESVPISHGEIIRLGTSKSRFLFEFLILDAKK